MVDYDMKQGKDGVYSVDNVVSQPSRKSKSGLLSKLGKAVRSGVAGAVALGSAYAMSMPQKANADLITSHANINIDGNPYGIDTVYYTSPTINFRDANGTLIPGGLTNKVVLAYIFDVDSSSETNTAPIGGLTLNANEGSTTNGWIYTQNDDFGVSGLTNNQVAVNGLNGGSFWTGGIDLNGDGDVGNYDAFTIFYDSNEGMFHSGDPNLLPGQYSFALNGVPEHPGSGTGPVTIDSIDIFAPYVIPEPAAISLIGTGIVAGLACRRRKSGNKS